MEKIQSLQQAVLGKSCSQINEDRTHSHTTYKEKLKKNKKKKNSKWLKGLLV